MQHPLFWKKNVEVKNIYIIRVVPTQLTELPNLHPDWCKIIRQGCILSQYRQLLTF